MCLSLCWNQYWRASDRATQIIPFVYAETHIPFFGQERTPYDDSRGTYKPSLRRATGTYRLSPYIPVISIHALLAEGDSKSVPKSFSLLHQNIKNLLL